MATLPPYNWRIPLRSDKPAGAQQITDLATDIAATVGTKADTTALAARVPIAGAKTVVTTPLDLQGDLVIGVPPANDANFYTYNQFVLRRTAGGLATVAHATATFANQSATLSQALVLFGDGLPLAQARALGLSVVTDENGTPVGVPVGEVLGLLLARLAEGGVSL